MAASCTMIVAVIFGAMFLSFTFQCTYDNYASMVEIPRRSLQAAQPPSQSASPGPFHAPRARSRFPAIPPAKSPSRLSPQTQVQAPADASSGTPTLGPTTQAPSRPPTLKPVGQAPPRTPMQAEAPSRASTLAPITQPPSRSTTLAPVQAPPRAPAVQVPRTPTGQAPSGDLMQPPAEAPSTSVARAPAEFPSISVTHAPAEAPRRAPAVQVPRTPTGQAPFGALMQPPAEAPSRSVTRAQTGAPSRAPMLAPPRTPTAQAPSRSVTRARTGAPSRAPMLAPPRTPTAQAPARAPTGEVPLGSQTLAPMAQAPATQSPAPAPAKHPSIRVVSSNSTHKATHQPGQNQTHVTGCPIDSMNLGVCIDVLRNILNITQGFTPTYPCCSVISGLLDLEVAVCFCTTLYIVRVGFNFPVRLSVLFNTCGKSPPPNFQCPRNMTSLAY